MSLTQNVNACNKTTTRFVGPAHDKTRLWFQVENEDLVSTLETLVERFGEDMAPYAVSLTQHLAAAFWRMQVAPFSSKSYSCKPHAQAFPASGSFNHAVLRVQDQRYARGMSGYNCMNYTCTGVKSAGVRCPLIE